MRPAVIDRCPVMAAATDALEAKPSMVILADIAADAEQRSGLVSPFTITSSKDLGKGVLIDSGWHDQWLDSHGFATIVAHSASTRA